MNIRRETSFLVTILLIGSFFSLLRNYVSLSRALSWNIANEYHDDSYVNNSIFHYQLDEKLESKYSTTHQRLRGKFSLILNDNEETKDGNNDFQHKGILRTSSQKHGKWRRIRHARADITFHVGGFNGHKEGTNYSKYVEDTRFVIDANETVLSPILKPNHTAEDFVQYNKDICYVLKVMTARKSLDVVPEKGIPPIGVNITANCEAIDRKMNGQGNSILALYGTKMIAAMAKVDFEFHCSSNSNAIEKKYQMEKARKLKFVFPWFASYQPASDEKDNWPYRGSAPTEDQVCSSSNMHLDTSIGGMPLEKMADLIRDDVRKMALQLVGSRSSNPTRTHPLVPLDVQPWIPDVAIDDVVIHLPCYDDVNADEKKPPSGNKRVGLLRFDEYTKHIHKDVRSIGIIEEASRDEKDNCGFASTVLADYLRDLYKVDVSVYKNDSLPLQYAKLAMARQSFSSFSTFGMIPIIGAFGEAYFQPANNKETGEVQNTIVRGIVSEEFEGFENIRLLDGEILSPSALLEMKDDSELFGWLGNTSATEIHR